MGDFYYSEKGMEAFIRYYGLIHTSQKTGGRMHHWVSRGSSEVSSGINPKLAGAGSDWWKQVIQQGVNEHIIEATTAAFHLAVDFDYFLLPPPRNVKYKYDDNGVRQFLADNKVVMTSIKQKSGTNGKQETIYQVSPESSEMVTIEDARKVFEVFVSTSKRWWKHLIADLDNSGVLEWWEFGDVKLFGFKKQMNYTAHNSPI